MCWTKEDGYKKCMYCMIPFYEILAWTKQSTLIEIWSTTAWGQEYQEDGKVYIWLWWWLQGFIHLSKSMIFMLKWEFYCTWIIPNKADSFLNELVQIWWWKKLSLHLAPSNIFQTIIFRNEECQKKKKIIVTAMKEYQK